MPGSAPASDHDEGSRQVVISGLNHTAFDLAAAATVARLHARLASRLLARLCRTGLVTRRVSMKGFTL
jgi:hypothetical protein